MNTSFLLVIGLFALAVIILVALVIRLGNRVERFTRGSSALSLESVITKLVHDQQENLTTHESLIQAINQLDKRITTSHRGFAMARFNAYDNTGGNQSYCCVFLDETGSGMVLSSLYSRERSNSFAKPIVQFVSEFELTKEEKQVLEKATASLGIKRV